MIRSEQAANQYLSDTKSTVVIGKHFHSTGSIRNRTKQKKSWFIKVLGVFK